MSKNNFVILIRGPGLYFACDPLYDKTWSNYIVPMQLAAEKKLYRLDSETVHWVIFAPAYRKRWNDDNTISSSESKEYGVFGRDRYTREWEWYKSDTWLHDHRKQTAEKLKAKRGPKGMPATSYLVRISQICAQHNIVYHPIEKPKDFWAYLEGLENGSISRIWYCGHASSSSLLLDLDHGPPAAACEAISRNFLAVSTIRLNLPTIKPKIDTDTDKVSVFYGCNTAQFAREWNQQFEVATEGAGNKITFQAIYKGDPTKNVLERLKTKPTNSGSPNWQKFPKPKKNGH